MNDGFMPVVIVGGLLWFAVLLLAIGAHDRLDKRDKKYSELRERVLVLETENNYKIVPRERRPHGSN